MAKLKMRINPLRKRGHSFVAPFSLNECMRRLKNGYKGDTSLIGRYQTIISCQYTKDNQQTGTFGIRCVPKQVRTRDFSAQMRGRLEPIDDFNTQIIGAIHRENNASGLISRVSPLVILMFTMLSLNFPPITFVIPLGILLLKEIYQRWREERFLINLLHTALSVKPNSRISQLLFNGKRKSKASKVGSRSFIAPYSLETCQQILGSKMNRSNEPKFHNAATVRRLDSTTVAFTIHRLYYLGPRNSNQLELAKVNGLMIRETDETTSIEFHATHTKYVYGMFLFAMLMTFGSISSILSREPNSGTGFCCFGIESLFLLAMSVHLWEQKRNLIQTLESRMTMGLLVNRS